MPLTNEQVIPAVVAYIDQNNLKGSAIWDYNISPAQWTKWTLRQQDDTPVPAPSDPLNDATLEVAYNSVVTKKSAIEDREANFNALLQSNLSSIQQASLGVGSAQTVFDGMGPNAGGIVLHLLSNLIIKTYILERKLLQVTANDNIL